ncbi:MAG: DUF1640 domain-containing protein [Magnetococcales bacterium]|nr:DUF1640 domain-containing protein [Magnetococcales bacterium]
MSTAATMTFDTLKFVRRLRDAGVEEKQAEAFSEAFKEVQDAQLAGLATKGDIQEVKRDIKELALRIAADMAKIHGDLATMRWGMAVTVGGIVALILKTFFPH